MRPFLAWFFSSLLKLLLKLRYRIEVKGLENLTPDKLNKPKGILFLANHPAEIDPCILIAVFWKKFKIHPIAIDYLFRKPAVRFFLDLVKSLSIPNFEGSSNSFKRKQMEKTYENIFSLLRKKENLLIYPAGGLKLGPEEILGGASGAHWILQNEPDINIVLVRTTGLWGSTFSRAPTGKIPELGWAFMNGFKVLLKNLLFFTPRRRVLVECEPAPVDFPWSASRRDFNRYLEKWFNAKGPEPLKLVSYSFYKEELAKIKQKPKEEEVLIQDIPENIRSVVVKEISTLSRLPEAEIKNESHLARDLGLDSLDMAQLAVSLKENFGIANVQSTELISVKDVLAFAAGIRKGKVEEEEMTPLKSNWYQEKNRPSPFYPEGDTLVEVFFKTCKRMKSHFACADQISGEVTYRKLRHGVLILAQKIQKMDGERIGILMPASIVGNALILATMLAGKIPVMVNWTLGQRNLRTILDQSKIGKTISSWNFLNRLESVELNGVDDQIILLEDLKNEFSLRDHVHAFFTSLKSPQKILKSFQADRIKGEDCAVILFTSGTESFPKGVPLSHTNLISNQKGAFETVKIKKEDILLGALPPFHSFGFSVTGLLPLLAGLRVVFSPNPTDGKRLAKAAAKWKANLLCLAPTFLKNLIRVAGADFKEIRLIVLGAEKTPNEMFEQIKKLNPAITVIEGYGITECSPILTLNPPDFPSKGVGLPFDGIEICVVHPETYSPVSLGEQGLILARGPNVFKGYLDQTLSSPFIEVEGKKWYKTGDLGFIDQKGYLTLSGRLKRFVKIGGEMISLASIEEALLSFGSKKGWKIDPESASLAICAKESEGKKGEIHLFTTFETKPEEANYILRESGMSNLVKVKFVHKLQFIPLLGTGKVDYQALQAKLKDIVDSD